MILVQSFLNRDVGIFGPVIFFVTVHAVNI